jgi:uroporphyrinogen-III synthase
MAASPSETKVEMADATKGLTGVRVLSLESRRAAEMAKLIANYGGEPIVAPSMREVPLESNSEALNFVRGLAAGGFQVVIFLTGVGARAITRVAESLYSREEFVEHLKQVTVIARGPKPLAVLKELGVPVALPVPEPNTSRDLLHALDVQKIQLQGKSVAVQEYGESNPELLAGLAECGAQVTQVPVYKWDLPENLEPLREAIASIAAAKIDLALFTTSVQIIHLLKVAKEMAMETPVREGLAKAIVGSIGPVTSEELRERGIRIDFEPKHPKMGQLVYDAAEQYRTLKASASVNSSARDKREPRQ